MRGKQIRKLSIIMVMLVAMIMSTLSASALSDPRVTIINPSNNSTISANSLLISIKITQPRTIKIAVYQESATGRMLKMTDSYTCNNYLSFYTHKLTTLEPGAYRIHVDTINSSGSAVFSTDQYVALKTATNNTSEVVVFDTSAGSSSLIQRMLIYVFGG